jgi:tetratricopeptide (TPR) repeat protein
MQTKKSSDIKESWYKKTLDNCGEFFKTTAPWITFWNAISGISIVTTLIILIITKLDWFLTSIYFNIVVALFLLFFAYVTIKIFYDIRELNKALSNYKEQNPPTEELKKSIDYLKNVLQPNIELNESENAVPDCIKNLDQLEIGSTGSKELNFFEKSKTLNDKGYELYVLENFSLAKDFFLEARNLLKVYVETDLFDNQQTKYESYFLYADILKNLGNTQQKLNMISDSNLNYQTSLEYYLKTKIIDDERVSRNPKRSKNPDLYKNMGIIHQKMNNEESAIQCYNLAITINENYNAVGNIKIGQIYLKKENLTEELRNKTEEVLNKAIKINPKSALAHRLQGDLFSKYRQHDDWIKAKQQYVISYELYRQQVISSFENERTKNLDPYIWNDLGIVCCKLSEVCINLEQNEEAKKYDESAEKCYKQSIQLNEMHNTKARINLGRLYCKQHNHSNAEKFFEEAFQKCGTSKKALDLLLKIRVKQGKGLSNYEKAATNLGLNLTNIHQWR